MVSSSAPKPELNMVLAEKLRTLTQVPEWQAFADLALMARDKWQSQLGKFNIGDSCETIAKDRIRWTAMSNGVETLFSEMNKLIQELNEKEKKEEDDDDDRE